MEGVGQESSEGDSASGAVKRVLRSRIIEVDNNSNSSTTSLGVPNSNGLDSVNSAADNHSITVSSSALKEVLNQSTPVKRNTRTKITSASSGLSETNSSPNDKRKTTNSLDDIESQPSVSPRSQCGSEASGISDVMVLRSSKVIPLQSNDKEVIGNAGDVKTGDDLKSCEVILNDVIVKLKEDKCTEKDDENAKNLNKITEPSVENESELIVTEDNVNEHESNESVTEVVNISKSNEDDTENSINNCSPSIINDETITEPDKIAVLNKTQDEVLANELAVKNKGEKVTKYGNDDTTSEKKSSKVSTSNSDDNDSTKLEICLDVIASSPSSSENDEEIASVHITSNEPKVLKSNGVINEDEKGNSSNNEDEKDNDSKNGDKDKGDNFVDSDTTEEFICVKKVSDRKPIPDVSSIDKSNDVVESSIEGTINIESKVINKSTDNSSKKSNVTLDDTLENSEGGTAQIEKEEDTCAKLVKESVNNRVVSDIDSDDSDFFPCNVNKEIPLIDKSKSNQKKVKKSTSVVKENSVPPVVSLVDCVIASESKKQQRLAQKVITTEQEKVPERSEVEFRQKKIEATRDKLVSTKSKSNVSETKVSDGNDGNNEKLFLKSREERGSNSKINLTNVFNLLSVTENKDVDIIEEDGSSLDSTVNEAITKKTDEIRKKVTIESNKPQYYGIGQDLLKDIVKEAVAEAVGSVKEELLNIKKEFCSIKNVLKKLERGKKRKFDESFPEDSDEDTSVTSVFDMNTQTGVESSDQDSLKKSKDELVQMLLQDVSVRLQLPKKKKKRKSIKTILDEQGDCVEKKMKVDITDADARDLTNKEGSKNNVTNTNKICKKKKINKLKLIQENDDKYVTENTITNSASVEDITKQYLNSMKSDSDKFYSKKKRSNNSKDINSVASVLINENDASGNTSLDRKKKKKKGKKRKFNLQLQDASVNSLVETSLGPVDCSFEKKKKKAGKFVSLEFETSAEQEVDLFSTSFDNNVNERRRKRKKKKNKLNSSKSDSSMLSNNATLSSFNILKTDVMENRNEKSQLKLEANPKKVNKNFVIDELCNTGNSSQQQLVKKKKKKKQKNGNIKSSSPLVTVSVEDHELPEEVSTRQAKLQSLPDYDDSLLFKKMKSWKSSAKSQLYKATPYKENKKKV